MPARTATLQSLELRAIMGDGDELGIKTDPGFRAAMTRYSEARNVYWAALWTGERTKIDAATAAMMRSAADCYAAVFAVAFSWVLLRAVWSSMGAGVAQLIVGVAGIGFTVTMIAADGALVQPLAVTATV